ncbi:MAG: phosphate ABC transporter ATP-binding protein PstB [Candidatus Limnocylindrales bacterium]
MMTQEASSVLPAIDDPASTGQPTQADALAPAAHPPATLRARAIEVAERDDLAVEHAAVGVEIEHLDAYYGQHLVLRDITLTVQPNSVTAIIGPSGCGKSTLIRCLNRMHEVVPGARIRGQVRLDGEAIYGPGVDPVVVRQRIGMVFQRPNPFPTMSIFDNVVAGLKLAGVRDRHLLQEVAERSLRRAALWDEVKDKLHAAGGALSGGQQQRLCIARAIAVEPEVVLMDEPASALDPMSTLKIEELIDALRTSYTIVIVTHNMQQAARVSDRTAFLTVGDDGAGYLVEDGPTSQIFTNPRRRLTEDYISGRFG